MNTGVRTMVGGWATAPPVDKFGIFVANKVNLSKLKVIQLGTYLSSQCLGSPKS